MKKLFLLLALLGMVAVGCSKDDADKGNDNKTEQPNENEGENEETPVFEIDPEGNYVVESEGGEVLLEVTTNLEYSVYIPKDARSWLFYEETRAVRNETVVLSVEPNSDTELRTATVELRDAEGETLEHFTIVQKPYGIIEDDEPEEEDPIFESDNEGNYSITAEGGEIVVTVATNIEYSVDIPKEAQSWISLADTRAVHLEKIVFIVAANDTMAERSADITLIDTAGEVLQDFTITQGAERNITCNNNEIIYTTKYGYAIDLAITDGFGGNYVSHTFEGGYGKIIFDNDVVTIPLNAFRDCNSITNIYLPSCVQEIGKGAFYGCSSLTSVTIPDSVTTIEYAAFAHCSSLTSVTIPDSVTSIGEAAFSECTSLTSVTIPNSVTTIGSYAFQDCSSLTSVTIPDSVTTIGNGAFYGCTSELIIYSKIIENNYTSTPSWLSGAKFTKLTIGDSVTTIGDYAFYNCSSLTSVTIGDSVTTIGRSAFSGCTGELIVNCNIPSASSSSYGAFYGSKFTSVTIGDSVTTIGDYAFYDCSSLTSVTIGDSVTTIGEAAFFGCTSITSLTIGDSVTTIGYAAFYNCSSLTSVTIGYSVTTIGNLAFYNCSSLTSVTIPDNVTTIGYCAFYGCSSLTSVTIPDRVTTIGSSAFSGCSSLTSVTIGDSVTEIGVCAFLYCSSLQEFKGKFASEDGRCLIIDGTLNSFAPAGLTEYTIPDSVTTIGGRAFAYCSITSVTIGDSVTTIGEEAFRGCTSLTSITIPDSVTTIGEAAFFGCTSITSLTIGDSVTTIGSYAFYYCSSLTSVYCKAVTPPTAVLYDDGYWDTFDYNASGRKIYVPMESVEAYKSAEGWSEYAYYIVGYNF